MLLAFFTASAAPIVDLWATTPAAETAVATYGVPTSSDATQTTYTAQDPNFAFDVGLGATAQFGTLANGAVTVDGALNLYSAEWERTPLDYRIATWNFRLGVGWRQWFPTASPLAFYGEGGMLLGWELFLPLWSSAQYQLGPGTYARLGLAIGHGNVRPLLGFKLGASLGAGRTTITATGPSAFQAEWHSSHAYAMVELGVALHPSPEATTPETP